MPKPSKAERERREQAAREARIRAALHWTEMAPGPDVAPPSGGGLSTGYLFNAYASRVNAACSSSVSHAFGQTDRTTTQGARWLYSTRLLALHALRSAVERECAERLAEIDRQIEEEQQEGR